MDLLGHMWASENRRFITMGKKQRQRAPRHSGVSATLGLSVKEFCKQEHIGRSTFYEWVRQGKAPALLQPGGRGSWTRITPEAVAEWRKRLTGVAEPAAAPASAPAAAPVAQQA